MAEHDGSYKALFSHPRMVKDLLQGFVQGDWTGRLDFTTLERVSGNFTSLGFRHRDADMIWKLWWKGEQGWTSLYLLIEFQSTYEPFMPVRLLDYVNLLYQDLIRQGKLEPGDLLPLVVALVLYRGRRPWWRPPELASMQVPVPSEIEGLVPRLGYLLMDERRSPSRPGNLVSVLFRLDASPEPERLGPLVAELLELLPRGEEESLRSSFLTWLMPLLRRTYKGVRIPRIRDLEEMPTMLEENLIRWRNKVEKAAKEKGLREGRREGLEEGREEVLQRTRRILLRQMKQRFGRVPRPVRTRVQAISSLDQLERLADKILVARSLEEMGLG
jgi:predicted transposase YdaD